MAPAAPSSLAAAASETTVAVDLSWQHNSDNETGFALERKLSTEDESGFAQILAGVLSANATQITDDDATLVEGARYDYRIKAYNDAGDSPYSDLADAYIPSTTGAAEQMMNGLGYAAWAATDDNLWVTWDDPSDAGNAVGQIEVGENSGQATGSDISIDYDQANETLYIGWIDTSGALGGRVASVTRLSDGKPAQWRWEAEGLRIVAGRREDAGASSSGAAGDGATASHSQSAGERDAGGAETPPGVASVWKVLIDGGR